MKGTGGEREVQVGREQGGGQERLRNGQAWGQTWFDMQIHTEMPRQTPLFIHAETPREILRGPPYIHPHFTRSAVIPSYRGGDNPGARWQAGHYLPLRTGAPYLPHLGSACLLLTSAPTLPENRVADGTWGAQVAGAGQCCELSCCCGEQGELPTWRAVTRTSQRLQETGLGWVRGRASQGSHRHSGTTGLSQPRLEAKAPQAASRHQLLRAAQTNL